MSPRQAERAQFGGMSMNEVLGGEKNYLGMLGAYSSPDAPSQAGGSWDSTVAAWRADNPTYTQQVVVQGQALSAEQKLAQLFPGSDSLSLNSTEQSRNFNQRYYSNQEASASNPVSAAFWHVAGLTSDAAHNLEAAGRGVASLLTDGQARSAAMNGLQQTWNHLPSVVIKGMQDFSQMSYGEQAGSLYKFGLESVATFAGGKVLGTAGDFAYQGGANTVKWLAPKLGDITYNYAQRTGLLFNAVEDTGVPTINSGGLSQVQINAKAGAEFQSRVSAYGVQTLDNYVEEVSVRPYTADGIADFRIRFDGLGTNPETQIINTLEAKSSATAPLTPGQARGFPLIEEYGGVVVGKKGGALYPAGTVIPPNPVQIIRPIDLPEGF
jgi:hypothetical protein